MTEDKNEIFMIKKVLNNWPLYSTSILLISTIILTYYSLTTGTLWILILHIIVSYGLMMLNFVCVIIFMHTWL